MPYGYEKFRLKNEISPNTIVHETNLIRNMLSFINQKYNKPIEPHEIRPADIKEFLDHEKASGNQDSTVFRKLSYIRTWFDYMWQINKIQYDFMPKLKYSEKLNLKPSKITVNYADLLKQKSQFLNSADVTLYAKLLFIFYMRGIRVRDIISITTDQFTDNGDSLILNLKSQSGVTVELNFSDPSEIVVLLEATERAVFRNVPYLFSSKDKDDFGPFRLGSIRYYLEALADYFGMPLRSEEVRFAFVHYLYTVEQKKIEEIQEILGISFETTSRILKDSLERIVILDYNKKSTSI